MSLAELKGNDRATALTGRQSNRRCKPHSAGCASHKNALCSRCSTSQFPILMKSVQVEFGIDRALHKHSVAERRDRGINK